MLVLNCLGLNMCTTSMILLVCFGINISIGSVAGGEYCLFPRFSEYCTYGCCEDDCCPLDNRYLVYIIVGSLFGGALVISFLVAVLCCFIKTGKKKGHVVAPSSATEASTLPPSYSQAMAQTSVYGNGHSLPVFTTDYNAQAYGVPMQPYGVRLPPIGSNIQPQQTETRLPNPSAPNSDHINGSTDPPAPAIYSPG